MTSEVKKTLKEMKKNKAPGIDNLTSDILILGGEESVKQLTKICNQIFETKKISAELKEAKMIILHKKVNMRDIINYRPISLLSHMYKLFTWILTDIKNYRPISLLSHMYKLFTRILQKEWKGFWLKPTKRTGWYQKRFFNCWPSPNN